MGKKVFYDEDARSRVLAGAKILYDAVKTTLGPKGRNVVISKSYGAPTVTKDGVTVAKGVDIKDVDDETLGYRVGAELIKQAANKLNDKAGDGTTTVTVLTYHILKEANKLIAAGHNPIALRNGLERVAESAIAELQNLSEEIVDDKRLEEVATISASDAEIGKLIAEVIKTVGKDGVVTVETSQGLKLESEVVEGFTFDRGFVSQYMVTDQARMEAVYSNPAIIVTDKKIGSVQEIMPLLEKLAGAGKKDLVLIAEDVEGEALSLLVLNKLKGIFNTVAVKAPSFGDRRKEILEDIATLVGATLISSDSGTSFENAELSAVGSAKKVIVGRDETTIVSGGGTKEAVDERLVTIGNQIKEAKSEYDKENLQKRQASLEGKVAVIRVGGATETEIEEKKFRVDDAVSAVKAALAEGVVAGGGVTLINIAHTIRQENKSRLFKTEEYAGMKLLLDALEQPFRELLTNSNVNADKYIDEIREKTGYGININSPSGIVDMKAEGVIDPTRVTKEVILNSVSVAGTAMTMGALVVDVPEPEIQQPMQMM